MDLRLPSFVDFRYYRMYPDPEKSQKSKIMFILMSRKDEMWSEFEKLVLKHGPEYQYKTEYIRELAGHCRDGIRCCSVTEEVTADQTLLWYLIERELYDLAKRLITQYQAKVTFSIKKFVRKRIRDRHRNRCQKEYFVAGGYREWPKEIDMDDNYEALTEFAKEIGIADFCVDESYPSYQPPTTSGASCRRGRTSKKKC